MPWSLVIHEEPDYNQNAGDILAAALPGTVVRVANLADAAEQFEERGRRDCQLIVSSLSPPADKDAARPITREKPTAVEFLQKIRGNGILPKCIFLVSYNDGKRADALHGLENVHLLGLGKIAKLLTEMARSVTGVASASAAPLHAVDLDIDLIGGKCNWRLRGTSTNPLEAAGPIEINADELETLVTFSRNAHGFDHQGIGQIGLGLYKLFMANNLKGGLQLALSYSIRDALEAARFRFHVDQKTSHLLVETLGMPDPDSQPIQFDHWMRRTPIFRKYGGHGRRHPLFKDHLSRSEPVQCLIIQGEAEPFDAAPGLARHFAAIPMAVEESSELFSYFADNHAAFGLAAPIIMKPGDYPAGEFGAKVRTALREHPWQLIHYVGHSAINGKGTAYLALGGGADDLLEVGELAELSSSLQFLFLSSCSGADAQFIMKLAERNVPAVAGYAWPIADNVALDFSREFYHNLFEGTVSKRFIEYAFMRSKRHLHDKFLDRPVWAAPLLFMQMLDAESEPTIQ